MKLFYVVILSLLFLGLNPLFSSEISEDETVTFFPTYGYCKGNDVIVNIHGWIYEFEEKSFFRNIFYKTMFSEEQLNNKYFKKRIRYFFVDNERNKKITIELANQKITLPPSKANGHFETTLTLKNAKQYIKRNILSFQTSEQNFKGKVHIVSEEGISVISDIDDTIKISNVNNKKELIKNSFSRPFKAVEDLASIYQQWEEIGANFHYVSGSPWQLYPSLEKFITKNNYPQGSFHLKYFRIKDSSIWKFIKSNQLEYKTKIIEKIVNKFPNKKYIFVGDSGEVDASVYAKIANKYPEKVIAIYIRNVKKPGDSIQNYEKIFSQIKQPWILFNNSNQLKNAIASAKEKK